MGSDAGINCPMYNNVIPHNVANAITVIPIKNLGIIKQR